MRILFALLILLSFKGHADSSAQCTLVKGIYENNRELIHDIRFETFADVFSFSNAKAFSFNLEGENFRFIRSDIEINKNIRAVFMAKKNGRIVRVLNMMIDRSPQRISKGREFYGNMIISEEIINGDWTMIQMKKSLRYNFYCRF